MKTTFVVTINEIKSDFDVVFIPESSLFDENDRIFYSLFVSEERYIKCMYSNLLDYISELLDTSQGKYKSSYIISGIYILRNDGYERASSPYIIRMTGYFEEDDDYFWEIAFSGNINSADNSEKYLSINPYKISRENS